MASNSSASILNLGALAYYDEKLKKWVNDKTLKDVDPATLMTSNKTLVQDMNNPDADTVLSTEGLENELKMYAHKSALAQYAPMKHASSVPEAYDHATSALYSHVKLSDVFNTPLEGGTVEDENGNTYAKADDGVGASQYAVYDAYNALNTAKANKDHSSTTTQHGVATDTKYGHAKIVDNLNADTYVEGEVLSARQGYELAQAIGNMTGLDYKKVSSLPSTGEKGFIYLKAKDPSDEENNIYEEYLWIGDKFEKIGDTKVDLADYQKISEAVKVDDTSTTSTSNTWSAKKLNDSLQEVNDSLVDKADKADLNKKSNGGMISTDFLTSLGDTTGTPTEFITKLFEYMGITHGNLYTMAHSGNKTPLFNYGILPTNDNYFLEIKATTTTTFSIRAIKQNEDKIFYKRVVSAGATNWKELATQDNLDLKQNSNSALKYLYSTSITSVSTTATTTPNYYIRIDGIPTDYTGSTRVKSWKIRTRYNHTYELVLTPWNNEGTNADRVLRLLATEGTNSNSCTVDCAYKFSSGTEDITMSIIFKITARSSATPFYVANLVSETADADNYVWTRLGNDAATVTLEDGSTMTCADYYATFTPCQKTEMATMDKVATDERLSYVSLTSTDIGKVFDIPSDCKKITFAPRTDNSTVALQPTTLFMSWITASQTYRCSFVDGTSNAQVVVKVDASTKKFTFVSQSGNININNVLVNFLS